ncbi:MAG: hypothetical protein J3K34DRAFT_274428 [Monoraphidium minutum]|nr:MAG: hypothetical protein J3K34DRAFT_274428 [Monoraphidium minutum]
MSAPLGGLAMLPIQTASALQPATAFHNTTSLRAAMQQNTLGVGYAGAGFLLFYYIGVSKVLQQLGIIRPGHTKIAGASAGVISAAVDYGFVSHDEFITIGKEFAGRCRANYNCAGTLGEEVARVANKVAPQDADKRLNQMGVAYMTLSTPAGRLGVPEGGFVNKFESRQDLMDAMHAGVYVPLWSGPSSTTKFRNQTVYDGAYRSPMPCPGGNTTYCIKVSVLPPWTQAELTRDLANPGTWRVLLSAINATAGGHPLRAALAGLASRAKAAPGQSAGDLVAAMYTYSTLQARLHTLAGGVEIWPGKWAKNPYSIARWMLLVLTPPTDAQIDEIVEMGKADGLAWARDMGFAATPEVLAKLEMAPAAAAPKGPAKGAAPGAAAHG